MIRILDETDIQQTTGKSEGSVMSQKASTEAFMQTEEFCDVTKSNNLIDFSKMSLNKALDAYTGELVDKDAYGVSDFIPVEYGKSYIGMVYYNETQQASWARQAVLFNSNKEYISRPVTKVSAGITIDKTEAAYIRIEFQLAYGTQKAYFAEGTTAPEVFEPYANKKKIKPEMLTINEESIPDGTISSSKLVAVGNDKLSIIKTARNLIDPTKITFNKKYINGNLSDSEYNNLTDKIYVKSNTKYSFAAVNNKQEWWYGNTSNSATRVIYEFKADGTWIQQGVTSEDGSFVPHPDTAYVICNINTAAIPHLYEVALFCEGDLPEAFIPYENRTEMFDVKYQTPTNYWNGKTMVTYGDSIVERGLFAYYIQCALQMKHLNRGVGGSGFVRGVEYYWANADGSKHSTYTTGSTAPEGTTLCEANMASDQRIDLSIPEDSELIIIAAGTNDHGGGATTSPEIGEISCTVADDGTVTFGEGFKNGVCRTVYKLMQRCPNAEIILTTPVNTRAENKVPTVNGHGLTLLAYAQAIKECAEYMGVPCIDIYGESGINQFNKDAYADDGLHPNLAGARKMAKPIIAFLSNFHPIEKLGSNADL